MDKPLATVVLLTKDEHDLVEDFLAYHGALFGRPNVFVVDNGSTHPRVLAAYDAHRALGGRVVVDARPFRQAAAFMTEHMSALAAEPCAAKFLLPLETDEFIFARPLEELRSSVSQIREAVHAALRSAPSGVSVIRYSAFWCSCVDPTDVGYSRGAYSRPAGQITRFSDQGWDKLAVRASEFVSMSQWCHHAEMRSGLEGVCADLGLIHFHDTGMRRRVERAEPVARSYGYVDPSQTLSENLEALQALRGAPIACGHKAEQVLEHLERLATLEAFRTHLGRLPASPEEMLRFSDVRSRGDRVTPDDAVRQELATGRLRRSPAPVPVPVPAPVGSPGRGFCWEELLYHETRGESRYLVRQVRDALRELDDGVLADAVKRVPTRGDPIRAALVMPPGGGPSTGGQLGRLSERLADVLRASGRPASLDVFDRSASVHLHDAPRDGPRCDVRTIRVDPWAPDALRALGRGALDLVVDASPASDVRAQEALSPLGGVYLRVDCPTT